MRGLMPGLALAALAGAAPATVAPPQASLRAWDFAVTLDGKPIGWHRFRLVPGAAAGTRMLHSEAQYRVSFLGIPVFRYDHEAREQWQGDCLSALSASTDDDGRKSGVQADLGADGLRITRSTPGAEQPPPPQVASGCIMSFAYWNPAMREQSRLLNPQTGLIEAVQIAQLAGGSLTAGGQVVAAERWRISGAASPIDVWYTADGDWVGLDAQVGGTRKLSYRLQ
ncbi:MAG: hypothetical protein KF778_14705 [Rhodocyclaceae bacterium]|nr:hypothetical protein [Rhodocyclaceae bacterium]